VAVVAAAALVLLAHGGMGLPSPRARSLDQARIVLAAATAVPLLGWRRWPLVSFVAVGVASILIAARGEAIWPPVGLAVALYLLVRGRPSNSPWARWRLGVVLVVLGTYLAFGVSEVGELLHSVLALAAAWFAGEVSRLRRAQLADLRDRAARVERDAARERDLAVAEERTRIARDLHDSVAHALNVISVRAGAARLRRDPDHALATVCAIEELSRATMADIDQVIGTLRTPRSADDPVEVPPGLAALDALVAEQRASGHEISLAVTGRPGALPAPAEHGVYRIVQEALTNASRYGAGATRVELTHDTDAIRVSVANRVEVTGITAPEGGGHGLIGMRERAHALGGEVSTGLVGEEFLVCARIPHDGRRR
jgi:signal transduction histidine kinase